MMNEIILDLRGRIAQLTPDEKRTYYRLESTKRSEIVASGHGRNLSVEERLLILNKIESGEVTPFSYDARDNTYNVRDLGGFHEGGLQSQRSRKDLFRE